jgi:hypothetical protein
MADGGAEGGEDGGEDDRKTEIFEIKIWG